MKDRIVRIVALVALCAMVYYFSFDQGRRTQEARVEQLKETLAAKERSIEILAAEIKRLKDGKGKTAERETPPEPPADLRRDPEETSRLNLRLNASRLILDDRIALTCLEIDARNRQARIQINAVADHRLQTETLGVGQSRAFRLAGRSYTLLLEQLHSSSVTLRIVQPN